MMSDTNWSGGTAVLAPPDEIQKSARVVPDELEDDDVSSAPEEASDSEIPGDPRSPHELQPPTKEAY